jgi:O-antigen/teichoic acid export membrane protein
VKTRALDETTRAGGILLAGSVVSKGVRLAGDLVVGRVLGAAGFGVIAAASSFAGILGELALLGTHRAALRFASLGAADGERALVRRALLVPLVAGGALAVAVTALRVPLTRLLFGDAASEWILPAFALTIPAIGVYSVLQFVARARRRFVVDTVIGDVCRLGLPCAGSVILLAAGFGLWGAALGFVAGTIATAIAALVLVRDASHAGARHAPLPGAAGMHGLLRVALPLSVGSSSILLMNELDKVVLAALRPEAEVGIYNAAFRVARQILIVMPALNAAISPFVAPLLAEGRTEELRRLYRRTVRWSLAAGWSAALLFCAFAGDFLGLFGEEFRSGTHVLVVVCLGHLVQAAAGTVGVVIQYSGNERKELVNGLLVVAASVALNLALVPRFGALGAAYASLLSLALVNTLRVVQAWRILEVMPFDRKAGEVLLVGVGGLALGAGLRAAVAGAFDSLGSAGSVVAVVSGMALGWAIYFAFVGVSADEAALLRLPKRWTRAGRGDASRASSRSEPTGAPSGEGDLESGGVPRSPRPACETNAPSPRRFASRGRLLRRR